MKTPFYLMLLATYAFLFSVAAAPSKDKDRDAPPPDLPEKLLLPQQTETIITVERKEPKPVPQNASQIQRQKLRAIFDPELERAVFIRDQKNIHATYYWEGGKTTQTYQIEGITFYQKSLKYLDTISISEDIGTIGLNMGSELRNGATSIGSFPKTDWYQPNYFLEKTRVDGTPLYRFRLSPESTPQTVAQNSSNTTSNTSKTYVSATNEEEGSVSDVARKLAESNEAPLVVMQENSLYLDTATLLPVMMEIGPFSYKIAYRNFPGSITPTGKFKETIEEYLSTNN